MQEEENINQPSQDQSSNEKQQDVVFLPLGGVGEIGMNLYLYGLGHGDDREWLMIDLGITFPDQTWEAGVDVIMPDIEFIKERKDKLAGLLLTHAHEDHFGAVIDLMPFLNVPVYATPYTAALLRLKMIDNHIPKELIDIRVVDLCSRFNIGSFDVEMVNMSHSIPEPNGVVLRMPTGIIFHSGDWKYDVALPGEMGLDQNRLEEIGREGVDLMVSDSTNAPKKGISESERDVEKTLEEIIKKLPNRAIVTTFASNLARVIAVAKATKAAERTLVVSGRAIWRVVEAARETGYITGDFSFNDQAEYGYLPRDKVVLLCTGSQGESRAAMARIALDEHPHIAVTKGDTVIFSSKTIPGNERSVSRIQNHLVDKGIEIITDKDALVHVSGHPPRGDMEKLYSWISPKAAIPMHGEAYHLESHADFAREQGVRDVKTVRNGQIIRVSPGPLDIVGEVESGRLYRDGKLLLRDDDKSVRERRRLAFVGFLVLSLVIGRKSGELMAEPKLFQQGLPDMEDKGMGFHEIIAREVNGTLKSLPLKGRKEQGKVSEAVRRAVRSRLNIIWGKKTVVEVLVSMVEE